MCYKNGEERNKDNNKNFIFFLSSWENMQFSKMVLQKKGRFQKKVEEIYICQIDTLVLELRELWSWEIDNIPEAIQLFTEYFEIKRKICLLLFQLYSQWAYVTTIITASYTRDSDSVLWNEVQKYAFQIE